MNVDVELFVKICRTSQNKTKQNCCWIVNTLLKVRCESPSVLKFFTWPVLENIVSLFGNGLPCCPQAIIFHQRKENVNNKCVNNKCGLVSFLRKLIWFVIFSQEINVVWYFFLEKYRGWRYHKNAGAMGICTIGRKGANIDLRKRLGISLFGIWH